MIQRVYEGAKKSKLIDQVIVATDNEKIEEEVQRFSGKVMITEASHQTGTDRCGEVAKKFANFDIILNIQGDEPLVDYRQLEQLIQVFENPDVKIATLGIKNISMQDINNPNRIKIVLNQKNEALYFSRSNIPNATNFKYKAMDFYPFMRHIGLYAYRRETLLELIELEKTTLEQIESLEQLRWLYHGYAVHVAETEIETPNIDVPDDVSGVLRLIP